MTETCCSCDFPGTDHAIRVHMARAHPEVVARAKGLRGRAPIGACPRCKMFHDEVFRPGWAEKRRKREAGRRAHVVARIPRGQEGEFTLGRITVPFWATKITQVRVSVRPTPDRRLRKPRVRQP